MMVNQIEGLLIGYTENKASDFIIVEVKQQLVYQRNKCSFSWWDFLKPD